MRFHLRHVVKRPVGSVIIKNEDRALKETRLFDEMIYEATEFGTVCCRRSQEDGQWKGLADGSVDGD